MRLTLCVNNDLVGCYALNLMMRRFGGKHEIAVMLSDRIMRKPEPYVPALDVLQFFERDLVQRLFPLLEGRTRRNAPWLGFNEIARYYDVPVQVVPKINEGGLAQFKAAKPDVIISSRYGYLFKHPDFFTLPTHGILNIHSGILPRYRGTMPTFRTMLAGDREIGITLHRITDAGIDTGDVVDIRRRAVEPSRSMLWHVLSLYPLAAGMAEDAVAALAAGKPLPVLPQKEEDARYFSFPEQEEIAAFEARGFKIMDREEYNLWLAAFQGDDTVTMPGLEKDAARRAVA